MNDRENCSHAGQGKWCSLSLRTSVRTLHASGRASQACRSDGQGAKPNTSRSTATLTGTTPTNGHAVRRLRTGCTEADAGSKTRSGTGRLRTRCWRVPDAGGTSILCVSMVNCSLSRKAGCRSRKAMRSVTGVDCEPNWAPERFAPGEKGLFECFSAVTWQPRLVSLEFRNRSSDRAVWFCANNAHSEITAHGHP